MRIYLLFSIMEAFISLMLKDVVDSYNLTVLWMFINSFVLIGWFYHKSKDTTMFMFLFIGFLLRLLMMIYDNPPRKMLKILTLVELLYATTLPS